MKILIVSDTFDPQVNGLVTILKNIIPILEKKGHSIFLLHPGLFFSISLLFYPEIKLALFTKNRIRKTFKDFSPDAVHIMTEGPLGFSARSFCLKNNIKFTTSYHTHFPLYLAVRMGDFWIKPVYKLLNNFHKKAERTFVVGEHLKQDLLKNSFSNLTIWPFGVDTKLFKRNISSPIKQPEKPVFVYFGRIAPEKDLEEFLKLELPGSKVVIGDGPSRKDLEIKYKGRVKFVGYKFGQELVDWLSISDVFVTPSKTETFGLTIIEALSCELPVAAFITPATSSLISNGKDGFLGNDLKLAALNCLKIDRSKCREKALSFSWEESARHFISGLTPADSAKEKAFDNIV